MQLVPSKFFITSGSAVSQVSALNAFDRALIEAGIAEQNLVPVSSVVPVGAERVERTELPMGAVTHCVLSVAECSGGTVSAGIAYAMRTDGKGGYVAESHMPGGSDSLKEDLRRKLAEIADARGVSLGEFTYAVQEITVPENRFGCSVASLVFTEYLK